MLENDPLPFTFAQKGGVRLNTSNLPGYGPELVQSVVGRGEGRQGLGINLSLRIDADFFLMVEYSLASAFDPFLANQLLALNY